MVQISIWGRFGFRTFSIRLLNWVLCNVWIIKVRLASSIGMHMLWLVSHIGEARFGIESVSGFSVHAGYG
jgi:hypothetical protein